MYNKEMVKMPQATKTLYKYTVHLTGCMKHETKRANNQMGHKIGKVKYQSVAYALNRP